MARRTAARSEVIQPQLPTIETSPDSAANQLTKRLKKLESRIRAQQKKNAGYREAAREATAEVQRALGARRSSCLELLKHFVTQAERFALDKTAREDDVSRLIDLSLDGFEVLDMKPEVPEWFFYEPARPWGVPTKDPTEEEGEEENEESLPDDSAGESEGDDDFFADFARKERERFEKERKLWDGTHSGRPKGEGRSALRQMYVSIARRAHPDTVVDPEERRRRTEFMQRVNDAYRRGDAHQLLRFYKEIAGGEQFGVGSQESGYITTLQNQIDLLEEQLADLRAELRKLKRSGLGQALKEREALLKEGVRIEDAFGAPIAALEEQFALATKKLGAALDAPSYRKKGAMKEFLRWLDDVTADEEDDEEAIARFLFGEEDEGMRDCDCPACRAGVGRGLR